MFGWQATRFLSDLRHVGTCCVSPSTAMNTLACFSNNIILLNGRLFISFIRLTACGPCSCRSCLTVWRQITKSRGTLHPVSVSRISGLLDSLSGLLHLLASVGCLSSPSLELCAQHTWESADGFLGPAQATAQKPPPSTYRP